MACGRQRGAALLAWSTVVIGCNATPEPAAPTVPEKVTLGPVRRALSAASGPQAAPSGDVVHSPPVMPPPVANAVLDARVLVITADGTDSALGAITGVLSRLGTPYDLLNASAGAPLTADQLATDNHGRYYAVILDNGTLQVDTPTGTASAFTNDEWTVLTTYEAAFGVRRAAFYTAPDAGYGFGDPVGIDTTTVPLPVTCTTQGASVFATANCNNPINISKAFAYAASPFDANTVPLLVDSMGRALGAVRHYPNGREALLLTFAQNDHLDHTLQLAYGVVHWVTKGLFLGERHAYVGTQIDDLFLPSDLFTGGTYRITDADLQAFHDWQTRQQGYASTPTFRVDFAFNGQGATRAGDALTAMAVRIGSGFKWIDHTYDHATLDGISYGGALQELQNNDIIVRGLGLQPYLPINLVTPNISGLTNGEAMRAAFDFGVRYVVSDTSVQGYNNVPYNQGQWNPLQPQILMIPRHPTNLFYNVSTPDQWVAEYNSIYASYWMRNLSYDEILDEESDTLLGYLLNWESDPWMFHQADLRNYDGAGHSILSDLLDMTFAKYDALVKLPTVSPTMDVLGQRVTDRTAYDAAGAAATIGPGPVIAVRAAAAATLPVTGLCTPGAEAYAGDWISHVAVQPGVEVRLSLSDCAGVVVGDGGVSDGGGRADGGAGAPDAGGGPDALRPRPEHPPATDGGAGGGGGGAGSGGAGSGGAGSGGAGSGGAGAGGAGSGGAGSGGAGAGGGGTAGMTADGGPSINGTGNGGAPGGGCGCSTGKGPLGPLSPALLAAGMVLALRRRRARRPTGASLL